ncbi:MAG: N-acetylglucosamine-6-phosphate deacetylase [Bacillota bacterium]
MDKLKICNGRVITASRILENGVVVAENGLITAVGEGDIPEADCLEIDAGGNYVSPGFIDIHVHGGGGHDFMDGTVQCYLGAAAKHAEHGTTAMIPTTQSSALDELKNSFAVFKEAKQLNKNGAEFLGLHLEGPYLSPEQCGAQDPRHLREPRPEEYKLILNWAGDIILWGAAPELNGALEFGGYLAAKGIRPAIAHSNAVFEQIKAAVDKGFSHVTHLYSGMSGVRRINAFRYAGVVESAFLIDELTVEVIADGVHLPASLLQLIYKVKGPARIALITDAMRASGMPPGESIIGSLKNGRKVIVEDGVAKVPDRSCFAGSVATADRLVYTMVSSANIPLFDAVRMMTSTPAAIAGVDRAKGSLDPGKDADIVIFDESVDVQMTIIKGRIVYQKKQPNR